MGIFLKVSKLTQPCIYRDILGAQKDYRNPDFRRFSIARSEV